MEAKKILFYLLAGLLGGCLPVMSVHPLYNDENVVFEKELLGTWVDDANGPETTWIFSRPDEAKMEYELVFSDDEGNKGIFTAYLVQLNKQYFLDICPRRFPSGEEDPEEAPLLYNAFFFVPVHTFIKVDFIEPISSIKDRLGDEEIDADLLKELSADYDYVLRMQLTDDESFKKLLKDNPGAVEHTSVEDRFILTASTKDLRAFVLKYAKDDRLFTERKDLIRKEAQSLVNSGRSEGKKQLKQEPR